MTSPSMRLKAAGLPRPVPRSNPSVVMATFQPSFIAPTRFTWGTRTSVKNTSAKRSLPSICFSGRTSTPGECMSMRMKLMPLCLGAAGRVAAGGRLGVAVRAGNRGLRHRGGAAAAVLGRQGEGGEPRLEQRPLPLAMALEGLAAVLPIVRARPLDLLATVGQPGAHL